MNRSIKKEFVPAIIFAAALISGMWFYGKFPEKVATHWNFEGQADGFSSRGFGAFFLPILMMILYPLFLVLPRLDPKKNNYPKFENTYFFVRTTLLAFFLAIHLLTGFANLGYNIPIGRTVPAFVGLMFVILGFQMKNVEQNWFMGFRFPWTLSSEVVWKKTNRLGGYCLAAAGVAVAISSFLPKVAGLTLFIIAILQLILVPMIYSYLSYKKEITAEKVPPA